MRRKILQLALMAAIAAGYARAGEIIERVVAVVNGHPILQSDWDEALRYQAFANDAPLDRMGALQRREVLDRLIDQELLREQMKDSDFDRATPEEIRNRIAEIRKAHGAGRDAGWNADLARYGLTLNSLERHVRLEINLARMIDVRLRPNVHIDSTTIEAYYRQEFLPQLRQSGVRDVPLIAVSPKIEELLAQQRVNQLLTAWLRDLRGQSEIHLKDGNGGGVTAQ